MYERSGCRRAPRLLPESLAKEMLASEQRLSTHQIRLRETMAAVLVASAEFTDLYAELAAAWRHLRSVRATFHAIFGNVKGNLPQRLYSLALASEPIDERVSFGIDAALADKWDQALTALAGDSTAPLPPVTGG